MSTYTDKVIEEALTIDTSDTDDRIYEKQVTAPIKRRKRGPNKPKPTTVATLPADYTARKERPIATGVLDYFPDAIAEVAYVSFVGNQQHNPGEPLHWAKEKSQDEEDAAMRHFAERFSKDSDGAYHAAKAAWRTLAFLQKLIEAEKAGMTYAEYSAHLKGATNG